MVPFLPDMRVGGADMKKEAPARKEPEKLNFDQLRVACCGLMHMCSVRGPRRKMSVIDTFVLMMKIPDIGRIGC